MLSALLILVIVAGAIIFLYSAEVRAFVFRPRKKVDRDEALKVVAEDWKHTGYIDFSIPQELYANLEANAEPHVFYLTIEEYRLLKTVCGGIAVERRWRRGSLTEARQVAHNYYQFLQEHPEKVSNEGSRRLAGSTRLLDHSAA
jgi:hypothetical protein